MEATGNFSPRIAGFARAERKSRWTNQPASHPEAKSRAGVLTSHDGAEREHSNQEPRQRT